MGNNKSSTTKKASSANNEKEMVHPQTLIKPLESVLTLDEISEMCLELEKNVQTVSMTVNNVIFGESESVSKDRLNSDAPCTSTSKEYDSEQIETKFQAMARLIQNLIHELTEQLDYHSKQVTRGSSSGDVNTRLIKSVVSLVNNVNNYMAMLIRNIRKLGSQMSAGDPEMSDAHQRLQKDSPVEDVIRVTQDIDAMLMALRETEKQRQDLENDVIDVMIICKDCRELRKLQEESLDSVEMNVKLAAVSIETGHSRKFKKF